MRKASQRDRRTSNSVLIRRFDLGQDEFRGEWPEHHKSANDYFYREDMGTLARRVERTFVPKEPIAIPHLALADFGEIEYADTQSNVVQDTI